MNMRLICLLAFLPPMLSAEELIPIDEGWLRIGTPEALSKNQPVRLCAWGYGREADVRITYLKFDLSSLPKTAKIGDLVLGSAEEKIKFGNYSVYGLAGGDWDSTSLNGQEAPGLDVSARTLKPEAVLLAELTVAKRDDQQELRVPPSSTFEQFLKEHASGLVTLIFVKKGDGSVFVATESDPARGPRLEWQP